MTNRERARPQGKTAASLRSSNLALVLREIAASTRPLSRADLATRLGFTRSTASRLVDELVEGSCLTEGDPKNAGRGRPAVPLYPASGTLSGLGIEINVDRTVISIVDLRGEETGSVVTARDCASLGPEATLGLVAEELEVLRAHLPSSTRLVGAHLVVPGLTDRSGRRILRAPNLHWDGTEPALLLEPLLARLKIPFDIGNDINSAALTLLLDARRANVPPPSCVYIAGEVGIGAAVLVDGLPLPGQHGFAGEFGHICVDPAGPRCGCGATGCLETFIGLDALLRRGRAVSMSQIVEKAERGDAEVLAVLADAGTELGRALSNALNAFDVSEIVLGGFLGELEPWLRTTLVAELERRVLWASYMPITIGVAGEPTKRSARGAAIKALQPVIADPVSWIDAASAKAS